jgi:hypothetical protein
MTTGGAIARFAALDETASAQRNSHRREVSRADHAPLNVRFRVRRLRTFDLHARRLIASGEREARRRTHRSNAGQSGESLTECVIVLKNSGGRRVARRWKRDRQREYVIRSHAGIHCVEIAQRSRQHRSADEEHERHRNLEGNRDAVQSFLTPSYRPRSRTKRLVRVGARCGQRGHEPECEGGSEDGDCTERECGGVDCDVVHARHPRRSAGDEKPDSDERDEDAGDAAKCCEDDTLGQKLSHDARRRRSQCATRRDFRGPRGRLAE